MKLAMKFDENDKIVNKYNRNRIEIKQNKQRSIDLIASNHPRVIQMRGTAVRVNKFNFTYHDLAYKVRENMFHALQPYDKNSNGLFQQPEIVQALVNILNEDQNEIRYVVANVFRYDRDGDKAVTYDEFVNFSVEQHFGQLAIQRLHRKGTYSRGKQRLINLDEFQITLNESLKYIASQGDSSEYEHLFNEVDLDHDGWIKYEDFFVFLREYFGSLSYAAHNPHPQPQVANPSPTIDFPEERFARLIYSQLKISVMQNDLTRSLSLKRQEVSNLLETVFHVHPEEKEQLTSLIIGQQNIIGYEKFMKVIVPFYFCEYDIHKSNIDQVNEDDFVATVKNACQFVSVKPSALVLQQIFRNADSAKKGFLEKGEYINIMGMILEGYQFDYRGTAHSI